MRTIYSPYKFEDICDINNIIMSQKQLNECEISMESSRILRTQPSIIRFSRLSSKNYEQTKESEEQFYSGVISKQFQRKPSKDPSRRSRLKSQQDKNGEANLFHSASEQRVTGYVAMSSLKKQKPIHEESREGSPMDPKKKKGHLVNSPQSKKTQDPKQKGTPIFLEGKQSVKSSKQWFEQLKTIKQINDILEKSNKALQQKNVSLKQENQTLKIRINKLNSLIEDKAEQISCLKELLFKERELFTTQKQISYDLEDIIIGLNDKIEELIEKNEKYSKIRVQSDQIQQLKKEVQVLKEQNLEMRQQIKYSDIETSMMKRAKYDLEQQQKRTKYLDNQNRKLMARLDSLNKVKKNLPFPQLKKYNHILESSLSFSIDIDEE